MPKGNKKGSHKITRPGKDIVASRAEEFRKRLLKLLDSGVEVLTIDLRNVKMIDSMGLGVVIAAHNSLKKAGGKLLVTNVSEDIYRLFKTMRLDQHFEVRMGA